MGPGAKHPPLLHNKLLPRGGPICSGLDWGIHSLRARPPGYLAPLSQAQIDAPEALVGDGVHEAVDARVGVSERQ